MISIRKYLDGTVEAEPEPEPARGFAKDSGRAKDKSKGNLLVEVSLAAYRATLGEMGQCSVDACPAEGPALAGKLTEIAHAMGEQPTAESVAAADAQVQTELREWGRRTARHYRAKADEVKQILLAMAQTTESVGQRDARHAKQIDDVTRMLRRIASLDDVTLMRSSLEHSTAELKASVERMAAEGKALLERMQTQVVNFQTRLEEAELTASIDALTRLRSRMWVEGQLEQRIAANTGFCVAILDIDSFKTVNDKHGHLVGDALLKQFAGELKSACRSNDLVGRWGGDEFLIVLDGELAQAEAQIERVRKWVCGQYTLESSSGALKLSVEASIGLAEWKAPELLQPLLERADAAMYACKGAGRERRRERPEATGKR